MDALIIIEKLLKEQHKSQKDLCAYIGKEKQVFTNWKSGKNKSYEKYLPQIADFLNVTIDCLLGRDTSTASKGSEEQLLIYFRNLNDFGKKKALDALADLNDVPKYLNADTSKNKKVAARKGGLEERPLTDDEKNIINEDCQVPEES